MEITYRPKMKNKLNYPESVETLDGNIYLIEKDKDGNVINKSETDGTAFLKMIVTILEQVIKENNIGVLSK